MKNKKGMGYGSTGMRAELPKISKEEVSSRFKAEFARSYRKQVLAWKVMY